MMRKSNYEISGKDFSEEFASKAVESFKESANFKEDDNTMANGTAVYTTKLATSIYYRAFNDFKPYFDLCWNLTEKDLGMPAGAGAYKIPKVVAARAVKLSDGQVVDYINDGKDSVTLETETFGIGTKINRRALLRYAPGVVDKLIQSASEAVLRELCTELITGAIAGVNSGNVLAEGISYNSINKAIKTMKTATNAKGVLFGVKPDFICFTPTGWYNAMLDNDFKTMVAMGQRNVPGSKIENEYEIILRMKKVDIDLAAGLTRNAKDVECLLVKSGDFICFLKETGMDVFDGRLPGTVDFEIIHAMDAGYCILNDKAAVLITAA
jgi:hypothetical protein